MAGLDFFLAVDWNVFGYLSADGVMGVFFDSGCVFFLLGTIFGNGLAFNFDLFLLFILRNILHRLDGALIHPALRSNIFEDLRDKLIKMFVNCLLID